MATTQERIVEAGRALIMTHGYSGFSYADVSEAVGVRKASIHHYFPAKSDLALAVVDGSRAQIEMQAAALADQGLDAFAELRLYTGYWERCILDGSASFCIAAMLASELPTLPGDVATAVQEHYRALTGWLARVLARGAATGAMVLHGPVAVEAEALLSLVYGAMLTARTKRDPKVFVAIVEMALRKLAPAG